MKFFSIFLLMVSLLMGDLIRNDVLETVYDDQTNLTWQDNKHVVTGRYVWTEAIDYCETLSFAGKEDWRVPNMNELFSIVSLINVDPTINTTVFKNTASYYYWSSTTYAGNTNYVWNIYFNQGHGSTCTRGHIYNVRCVRGIHKETLDTSSKLNNVSTIYYLLD